MRPAPIHIVDPHDPSIAGFRDIRERDLARRDGLFIAEGKVVLAVMVRAARFETHAILVLEIRLAGLADILEDVPPAVPVFAASSAVIDEIAGFHLHRGVLALGRRRPVDDARELLTSLPEDALVVGLCGISNHDNVGAIFRNAAAFGADAVLLDETCCDPLYRKAIRVSVGAVLKTPYAVAGGSGQLIEMLKSSGYTPYALSPTGKIDIGALKPAARAALLLGTEGEGLPAHVLASTTTVRIPIVSDFDSLNVASASAIALHRFRPERR